MADGTKVVNDTKPSRNMRTPYEAYLEQENDRLRAENKYLRDRDEASFLRLSEAQDVHEEVIEAHSADMVEIARIKAGPDKHRGYAVHIVAAPIGATSEYSASYRIDELSAPGVRIADIVNHVLPKMHEKFVLSLSDYFRKNAVRP